MPPKRYTPEQKRWALEQLGPPHNRQLIDVARELGTTAVSVRTWRNEQAEGEDAIRSKDKSSTRKFQAVLETAHLSEAEVSEYCRRKGIEPQQLAQWRLACEQANRATPGKPSASGGDAAAKDRIRQLERELRRKEAALAEAAALLVLRKKATAIWGKEEDE